MLKTSPCRNRERLDPLGIARTPRHVHLGGADRRGHAAVDIALKISDGLLTRRVVAKRDVDMGVDQAGNGGRPISIDDDVAGLDLPRRRHANRLDLGAGGDNRVALNQWSTPIAGNDRANVGDGETHARSPPASAPIHSIL